MQVSAHNTANLSTEDARAQRVTQQELPHSSGVQASVVITESRPDIITESVEQIYTPQSLRANVNAVKTENEMQQEALDLFG